MIRSIKQMMRRRFPLMLGAFHGYRRSRDLQQWKGGVTPDGFRFLGDASMVAGTFEPEESAIIGAFAGPGRVFIDVGANYGYYVCLARQKGSEVVAVEPLPENLAVLYANLDSNGWNDTEVFPLGVSDKPRVANLYGAGTAASLLPNWAGTSEAWKRQIALSTLDHVLAGSRFQNREMLIKIDVEGAELDVLRGASATLQRTPKPKWLLEICLTENHPDGVNPQFAQVFDLFFSNAYQARSISADMRLVSRDEVERWARTGKRDFGYVGYLFEGKES